MDYHVSILHPASLKSDILYNVMQHKIQGIDFNAIILTRLGFPRWLSGKNRPCLPMQETWVSFLGRENPLEKEMATHSSILAWEIPWIKEPDRLHSTGSERVGHNLETKQQLARLQDSFCYHHFFTHLFVSEHTGTYNSMQSYPMYRFMYLCKHHHNQDTEHRDSSVCPLVKTPSYNAGAAGSISSWEPRSHMAHG